MDGLVRRWFFLGDPKPIPRPKGRSSDLVPVFGLLWVASVVRVVAGVLRHETFGTLPTLAALAVVGLPLLLRDHLR
jgi:hypothetical protein